MQDDTDALISQVAAELGKALGEPPRVDLSTADAALDPGIDALMHCTRHGDQQTYAVQVKNGSPARLQLDHLRHVSSVLDAEPLLVSHHIGEVAAHRLRDRGIQYVDALGNAHLHFGGVLIDVQGRRQTSTRTARPKPTTNLVSPRRAQIIMCLLVWPDLLDARLQDLADVSGTSPSQVHQTLKLLDEAGYMKDGAVLRSRRDELIDLWTSAYPTQLSPTLDLGSFTSQHPGVWPEVPEGVLAHRESAADELIRPATATIYVAALTPDVVRANRWTRSGRPDVFVRHRFWTSPHERRDLTGTADAPWLLVLADLLASSDPRPRAVAHDWRQTHAR